MLIYILLLEILQYQIIYTIFIIKINLKDFYIIYFVKVIKLKDIIMKNNGLILIYVILGQMILIGKISIIQIKEEDSKK